MELPRTTQVIPLSQGQKNLVREQEAVARRRTAFETAVVRIRSLWRSLDETLMAPSCFISYAWGERGHERKVCQMATDLRNARINVVLDRSSNPPGSSLSKFTDRILSSEFVVVAGTPELRQKYDTQKPDSIVASELQLINTRLRKPTMYGPSVIPLLLAGEPDDSFTPQLQDVVFIDFRDEDFYFAKLLDLIWRLYELPFDNPLLDELRASVSPMQK